MTTAPDVHWESWRRLRDPAAFEALVRPEMGRALSFARSLGCSEADAEDVLQESLVRLAAERSDGPSRIGVRAWLYRTVRDRARSRRRSWWRRRNREARAARPEAAPPRTGDLEAREQVQQALDALPDAEREAVRLRYLQDLDYAEMAHVLGVSENACRTRVHRALETLKKRFGAGVATMVAALPLPVPTHSEHLLREVLRRAIPDAAGRATVAAGWKIAGAAAVLAGVGAVAAVFLPGENGSRVIAPPHPLVGEPRSAGAAVNRSVSPVLSKGGQAEASPTPAPLTPASPGAPTSPDAVTEVGDSSSVGLNSGLLGATALADALKVDPAIPAYARVEGVSGSLKSIGSDMMNEEMTLWAEGFRRMYPNVQIEIEGKGSGTAPPALIAGTAQFGPMSREMKTKEIGDFEKAFGYRPTGIATSIDMVAVFVHKDNPLAGLSFPQVDAIFSRARKGGAEKEIVRWGDLGLTGEWADKPISLYGRNSASGTYGYFKQYALFGGDFKDSVKEQAGTSAVVQAVGRDRYAMGYGGIGYRTADVRAVPLARKAGESFVEAVPDNAYSGKYPMARFLFVYLNIKPGAELEPLRREFLRYILSVSGQEEVVKAGYFPLPAAIAKKQAEKAGL